MMKKKKYVSKTKGPDEKKFPLFQTDWEEFVELSRKTTATLGSEVLRFPVSNRCNPVFDRFLAKKHVRLIDIEGDPSDKLCKIFKITKRGKEWYEAKVFYQDWYYDPADDEEDEGDIEDNSYIRPPNQVEFHLVKPKVSAFTDGHGVKIPYVRKSLAIRGENWYPYSSIFDAMKITTEGGEIWVVPARINKALSINPVRILVAENGAWCWESRLAQHDFEAQVFPKLSIL